MFESIKDENVSETEKKKILAATLEKIEGRKTATHREISGGAIELKPVAAVPVNSHRSGGLKLAGVAAAVLLVCGAAVFAATWLGGTAVTRSESTGKASEASASTPPAELTFEDTLSALTAELDGETAQLVSELADKCVSDFDAPYARNDIFNGYVGAGDSYGLAYLLMLLRGSENTPSEFEATVRCQITEESILGANGTGTDMLSFLYRGERLYVACYNAESGSISGGVCADFGIEQQMNGILNLSVMSFGGLKNSLAGRVFDRNLELYIYDANGDIPINAEEYMDALCGITSLSDVTRENIGEQLPIISDENNFITDRLSEWTAFISNEKNPLLCATVYKPSSNTVYRLSRGSLSALSVISKNLDSGEVRFSYFQSCIYTEFDNLDYVVLASYTGEGRDWEYDIATAISVASQFDPFAERNGGAQIFGFAVNENSISDAETQYMLAAQKFGAYTPALAQFAVGSFLSHWKDGDSDGVSFYLTGTEGASEALIKSAPIVSYGEVSAVNDTLFEVEIEFAPETDSEYLSFARAGKNIYRISCGDDYNCTQISAVYLAENGEPTEEKEPSGAARFAYTFACELYNFDTITDFKEVVENAPLHFGLYHVLCAAIIETGVYDNTPEGFKELTMRVFGLESTSVDFTQCELYDEETGLLRDTGHGGNWLYYDVIVDKSSYKAAFVTIRYYADAAKLVPAKTVKYAVTMNNEQIYVMLNATCAEDFGLMPLRLSI